MFNFGEPDYKNNAKPIYLRKDRDKFINNIYILRVWVSDWKFHTRGFPSRDIAIQGNNDLDTLASIITESFDFDLDHLYEFSDLKKSNKNKDEKYTINFENIVDDKQSFTENIIISQIFKEKKKMLFLFDYGDMWHFIIQCKEIREPKNNELKFPYIFNIKHESPEQYPEYDEEYFDQEL